MVTGLFPMCGDILHAGHVAALKEAKNHCDKLIVALNTHPDGKHPVESVYERWSKLTELRCVDEVIPYQGKKDMQLLCSILNYDIRFLGEDYMDRDWDGKEQEHARNIKPHFLSRNLHGLSSTSLKLRIKDDNRYSC